MKVYECVDWYSFTNSPVGTEVERNALIIHKEYKIYLIKIGVENVVQIKLLFWVYPD